MHHSVSSPIVQATQQVPYTVAYIWQKLSIYLFDKLTYTDSQNLLILLGMRDRNDISNMQIQSLSHKTNFLSR